MTYNENLTIDWCGIKISTRTYNCFKNNEIENIEQLCSMTQADLLRWSNFGRKSLHEIEEQLAIKGLGISRHICDPRYSAEGEKLFQAYKEAKEAWEIFRETYFITDLKERLRNLRG